MLTDLQVARYSRQIILPSVGGRGQQQLLSAAVTVAGRPGMARVVAMYLAAAGIGRVFLIGAGRAVCDDLETLNPDCRVTDVGWPLADAALDRMIDQSRAVVCAAGGTTTGARLDTRCLVARRPLLYGRVSGTLGEAALLGAGPDGEPCFECYSRHGTPDHAAATVAPPMPAGAAHGALAAAIGAFIGTILATEAIKLTLNLGSLLAGHRLVYDALSGTLSNAAIGATPGCVACSARQGGGSSVRMESGDWNR